ncbi:hypothetical protein PIB30_064268, partial [Stylosanthes scabra]|nr:hypothetical protein [Stylosanthes scabra]
TAPVLRSGYLTIVQRTLNGMPSLNDQSRRCAFGGQALQRDRELCRRRRLIYDLIPTSAGLIAYDPYSSGLGPGGRFLPIMCSEIRFRLIMLSLLQKMGKKSAANKDKAVAELAKKKGSRKNQGHEFRCLPKIVAQMFIYLKEHPDKRALVDEMGFGALSYLPNEYLNQRLLKQIYYHYDIYDNTIYSDASAVNITTEKIGHALGLSSRGISESVSLSCVISVSVFPLKLISLTNVVFSFV